MPRVNDVVIYLLIISNILLRKYLYVGSLFISANLEGTESEDLM